MARARPPEDSFGAARLTLRRRSGNAVAAAAAAGSSGGQREIMILAGRPAERGAPESFAGNLEATRATNRTPPKWSHSIRRQRAGDQR